MDSEEMVYMTKRSEKAVACNLDDSCGSVLSSDDNCGRRGSSKIR